MNFTGKGEEGGRIENKIPLYMRVWHVTKGDNNIAAIASEVKLT